MLTFYRLIMRKTSTQAPPMKWLIIGGYNCLADAGEYLVNCIPVLILIAKVLGR